MVTIYNTTLSATSQRHFSDSLGGEKNLCMSTGNHQHRPRNWAQIQAHIYAMARMIVAGLDSRLFEMTADTMTFVSITA